MTLAPGMFVKLFALPLNRFAVTTLAPLIFPPVPVPTIMPVLATVKALAVPLTPKVTLPLATGILTLLVPLTIPELTVGNAAKTPFP